MGLISPQLSDLGTRREAWNHPKAFVQEDRLLRELEKGTYARKGGLIIAHLRAFGELRAAGSQSPCCGCRHYRGVDIFRYNVLLSQ